MIEIDQLAIDITDAVQQHDIRRANAIIAELRKDKARLDWISSGGREMNTNSERSRMQGLDGYYPYDPRDTWSVGNNRFGWCRSAGSLRAAIDAAMAPPEAAQRKD